LPHFPYFDIIRTQWVDIHFEIIFESYHTVFQVIAAAAISIGRVLARRVIITSGANQFDPPRPLKFNLERNLYKIGANGVEFY
jgi:hypothetical protein